jgi:hypothetical protein
MTKEFELLRVRTRAREAELWAIAPQCEHIHVRWGDDGSGREVEPDRPSLCQACGGRPKVIKVEYVKDWRGMK